MLINRPALLTLSLAALGGLAVASADRADARGQCAAGQIYRVSQKTCVSRQTAMEQGIIGRRKAAESAAAKKEARASRSDEETTQVARTAPAVTSDEGSEEAAPVVPKVRPRARTAMAQQSVAPQASAPATSPQVKIQIVRTEPSPVPAILMPNWPFGELPSFPKRMSP